MPRSTLSLLRLTAIALTGISTMGCAHAGRAYWVASYPPPPPRIIVVPPPPPVVYAPAPYYYQSPYQGGYGDQRHYHHHHYHSGYGRYNNRGGYDHRYDAHPPQIREVRPGEWQNRR